MNKKLIIFIILVSLLVSFILFVLKKKKNNIESFEDRYNNPIQIETDNTIKPIDQRIKRNSGIINNTGVKLTKKKQQILRIL